MNFVLYFSRLYHKMANLSSVLILGNAGDNMEKVYLKDNLEVDVTDKQAYILRELRREQWRQDAKYKYYCRSLETIESYGNIVAKCDYDPLEYLITIEDIIEKKKLVLQLRHSIIDLLPKQKDLIYKVYYQGKTQRQIALQEHVDESAISKRMARIYKRLRNSIVVN